MQEGLRPFCNCRLMSQFRCLRGHDTWSRVSRPISARCGGVHGHAGLEGMLTLLPDGIHGVIDNLDVKR
eukprot:5673854-Prorocentrum_lima.AAC.1